MNFLVLDTETTGLPVILNDNGWCKLPTYAPYSSLKHYDSSRLVQFSWIVHSKKTSFPIVNDFIVYQDDIKEIPEAAYNVHKISKQKTLLEGMEINEVLDIFLQQLKLVDVIVAHNISFDLNVILSECYRHGRKDVIEELLSKKIECTMDIGTKYYKYKTQRISLARLHKKLFNKGFENAHDALADTIACRDCYVKMKGYSNLMC